MPLLPFDETQVRAALRPSWSRETAVQWTAEYPASGQCNVTAAVIQDLFGGEILRTELAGIWHYYNRIDGKRVDLTDSQFNAPGARFAAPETYQDVLTDHKAAMEGIAQREYDTLRASFLAFFEE